MKFDHQRLQKLFQDNPSKTTAELYKMATAAGIFNATAATMYTLRKRFTAGQQIPGVGRKKRKPRAAVSIPGSRKRIQEVIVQLFEGKPTRLRAAMRKAKCAIGGAVLTNVNHADLLKRTLEKIAKVVVPMGVSEEWLMTGEGQMLQKNGTTTKTMQALNSFVEKVSRQDKPATTKAQALDLFATRVTAVQNVLRLFDDDIAATMSAVHAVGGLIQKT